MWECLVFPKIYELCAQGFLGPFFLLEVQIITTIECIKQDLGKKIWLMVTQVSHHPVHRLNSLINDCMKVAEILKPIGSKKFDLKGSGS